MCEQLVSPRCSIISGSMTVNLFLLGAKGDEYFHELEKVKDSILQVRWQEIKLQREGDNG